LHFYFACGRCIGFGNSPSTCKFPLDLTCYIASVYDEGKIPPLSMIKFSYDNGCSRFAMALRYLVFANDDIEERADEEIFAINVFNSSQMYIASSKNGVGLAAKGGDNGVPHNHNDVGSFHVFKNGFMPIADIGAVEYQKDYFGALRYTFFATSSASHNVPIVNGKYQLVGKNYRAKDVTVDEGGIVCDIAQAYDDDTLNSLVRQVKFDTETSYIDIIDSYKISAVPDSVVERFVSFDEPIIKNDCVLFGKEEICTMYYDANALTASLKKRCTRVNLESVRRCMLWILR